MADSYFPKLDSNMILIRSDLVDQIDKKFQKEKILVLKSTHPHLGKSTLAIQYAWHFSSQSKHNFVYFMKAGGQHLFFEFKQFSQLLNIECSVIVEEDVLVKRVYTEIVRRSWNPHTHLMFIFDDCYSSIVRCYLKNIPKNVFFLITTKEETFNLEICNQNNYLQINQHSQLDSESIKSFINELSQSDQWNVLKYFAFLDSDFIPIDILNSLVDNNHHLKIEQSTLFTCIEQNDMKGFRMHSIVQKEIRDLLCKQNEMKPIIEKLSDKIECLTSLKGNKIYYYNILKVFEFLISLEMSSLDFKANWLFLCGEFMLKWHNYCGAIDCFEKSYNFSKQERCLIKLTDIFMHINKYENALKYYILLEESNCMNEKILFQIGLCYFNLKDYNKSYDYLQESLDLKKLLNKSNELSYAMNLKLIGMIYHERQEFNKAIELYEKSLKFYREIVSDRNEISQVLTKKALTYLRMGLREKAVEVCEESLAVSKSLELNKNTADTMKIIGEAYYLMSKYKLSLKYYEDSFKLMKQVQNVQNSISLAICLHELGKCNKSLGRHKKTLDYYKEALKVYNGLNDENSSEKTDQVLAWINAGHIYDNLGKTIKAIELYEKSLELLRKIFF